MAFPFRTATSDTDNERGVYIQNMEGMKKKMEQKKRCYMFYTTF